MSGRQYLKNHLPVILLNLLGMLALALFLLAAGNPVQSVLFVLAVWLTVVILWLAAVYLKKVSGRVAGYGGRAEGEIFNTGNHGGAGAG